MILNDEKVIRYITRFESIDDFIKYEQEKKRKNQDQKIISFEKEKVASKSFVKIG